MLIFQTVSEIKTFLAAQRRRRKRIGFAPTMGALHQGHLTLVQRANAECDLSVSSIFVNPTQFNDPKDLEKYPRTAEKDIALLESVDCKVLFMPPVAEVYPPGLDLSIQIDFGNLEKVMEGVFRPGHFKGMATVVHRLLDIVRPQRLYMGQKDFQQLSIVRDMLRQTKSKIELVMCPTMRESDGLAMSSRNMRLTPEMRQAAPVIYQTLLEAKNAFGTQDLEKIKTQAMQCLRAAQLRPEYFVIVDGITLLPIQNTQECKFVVACVAAFAGEIRLIDNLVIQEKL